MSAKDILLVILIVAIVVMESRVDAGLQPDAIFLSQMPSAPCGGNPTSHVGKGVKYAVNGTMAVLMAQLGPNTWDEDNVFVFLMKNLTEQYKSPNPSRACDSDLPVGNSLDLTTCTCQQSTYLNESDGWKDEGVQFVFSDCPGHAQLNIRFFLAIPNTTHAEFFPNLMNGSTVSNFSYAHPYVNHSMEAEKASSCFAQSLPFSGFFDPDRVGVSITNWNWSSVAMANETYLAITYQFFTHSSTGGNLHSSQTESSLLFNITINAHSYMLTLERGIILDDEPSLYGHIRSGFNVDYPDTTGYLGTEFVQGFCNSPDVGFQKWRSIQYDPTIVALFDPFVEGNTPPPPPSPALAKQRKQWIIGVAVGIPIAAILIVSVVLLTIFVPQVRLFFQPYSQRNEKALQGDGSLRSHTNHSSSSSSSSKANSGWNKASKPE